MSSRRRTGSRRGGTGRGGARAGAGVSRTGTTPLEAFAVPTAVAAAVLAAGGSAVWRSFRPRRAEYRAWADRLKDAWTRASASPEAVGPDAMAMLTEASVRVPGGVP